MMKQSKGFTLIETILVLAIGLVVSVMGMRRLSDDALRTMALAQGKQLETLGKAANAFVASKYPQIIGLGGQTLTGCSGSDLTRSCTITLQQLADEGLLPANFSNTALMSPDSGWTIRVKNIGTAPNYNVTGAVISQSPYTNTGSSSGKVQLALAGLAAQTAGADAGVVQTNASGNLEMLGMGGTYTLSTTDAPHINAEGQIGFLVGSSSAAMNAFLRRDGTLPMTGTLQMGGNDINSAKTGWFSGDVNAGGKLKSTGNVETDTDVSARGSMFAFADVNAGRNLNVDGNSSVAGASSVGGNATVGGNNTVTGTFSASSNRFSVDASGNTSTEGNQSVGGTSSVAGNATITGKTTTSTITPTLVITPDTACTTSGEIAKDSQGLIYSCQGGIWLKATGTSSKWCKAAEYCGASIYEQVVVAGKWTCNNMTDGTSGGDYFLDGYTAKVAWVGQTGNGSGYQAQIPNNINQIAYTCWPNPAYSTAITRSIFMPVE